MLLHLVTLHSQTSTTSPNSPLTGRILKALFEATAAALIAAFSSPRLPAISLPQLMQATLDGAGLCLLPLNLAQAAIRDGRMVEVMAEFRGRELVLHAVQPPGHLPVPKTRALIDFLTEHFGPRAQRNEAREK